MTLNLFWVEAEHDIQERMHMCLHGHITKLSKVPNVQNQNPDT